MGTRRTKLTTIRLDLRLADRAKRALGAKSRTEAVHRALEEVVHLDHSKQVMLKYGGKLKFEGYVGEATDCPHPDPPDVVVVGANPRAVGGTASA